ncbi:MAG: LytTR family DNA-binding domain-containing protein [Allosphingosinicella sp.]|uniref:LytTR family DNA-binding domain-containing protein n=1 Tax=Allosphingosinicella sp. TaxID=2823234 RepID=UPI0039644145
MAPTSPLERRAGRFLSPERGRDLAQGAAVALGAAALLALAGAFGTGEAPFLERLVYWTLVMAVGAAWGEACQRLLAPRLDGDARPWTFVAALTALVAAPMCLFVWAATGLFFGGALYPLSRLAELAIPVVSVTAAMCAMGVFLRRATPVRTHAAAVAGPPKFVARLPLHLRAGRLIAVQAEDHYLRVHTDLGSHLILMRLSDALAELDGVEGAQTHRSWWVARDAVRGAARGDGRATLTLDGGLVAPVSRRYARALRAAGWF